MNIPIMILAYTYCTRNYNLHLNKGLTPRICPSIVLATCMALVGIKLKSSHTW